MVSFHNRSDEELVAEIESLKVEGLANFASTCERLTELAKRGYKHPLHRHSQYRHHAEVSSGKLIPAIVVMFDGDRPRMACFRGRPEDVQRTVASGREFDVVLRTNTGTLVERKLSAGRMSLKTLRILFPEGKPPRPLSEQRAILQAELNALPKTHLNGKPLVQALPGKEALRVAGSEIPLTAINAALVEMGYRLVKEPEELQGDSPRARMLRQTRDAYEAGEPSQPPRTSAAS